MRQTRGACSPTQRLGLPSRACRSKPEAEQHRLEAFLPAALEEPSGGAPEPGFAVRTGGAGDEPAAAERVEGGGGVAAARAVDVAGGDGLEQGDRGEGFAGGGGEGQLAPLPAGGPHDVLVLGLGGERPEAAGFPELEAAAGLAEPLGVAVQQLQDFRFGQGSPARASAAPSPTRRGRGGGGRGSGGRRGCSGRRGRGSGGRSGA